MVLPQDFAVRASPGGARGRPRTVASLRKSKPMFLGWLRPDPGGPEALVTGTSIAILFTDLRAAFYSILTKEVCDRLLTDDTRQVALRHVGFDEAAVSRFEREH